MKRGGASEHDSRPDAGVAPVSLARVPRNSPIALLVIALAACGGPPPLPPPPRVPIPESMQAHFMTDDGTHLHLWAHANYLTTAPTGIEYGDTRLHVTSSRLEGERYVIDRVAVIGTHSATFGGIERRIDTTCGGTATYENDAWTLALTGDYPCTQYNVRFTRFEPRETVARRTPRGEPSHDGVLHVLVPPDDGPFAHALQGIETMRPGDAPCPVTLRAPHEDQASGADPGAAALRHRDEGGGEEFAVVRVESGVELPNTTDSRARYQAVYVQVESVRPSVDAANRTFVSGFSRGRAYLVDTQEHRVVCVGDVSAQNGDRLRAQSNQYAELWLGLQLATAEERAVALGMRAPAVTEHATGRVEPSAAP